MVAAGHAVILIPLVMAATQAPFAMPQSLTIHLLAKPQSVRLRSTSAPTLTPLPAPVTLVPLLIIARLPSSPYPAKSSLAPVYPGLLAPVASPVPRITPTDAAYHMADWQQAVLRRLQAVKKYPLLARDRGEHGIAWVSFTLSRNGKVIAAVLIHSTGSVLLDAEAADVVYRAEPLPAPPPDLPGGTVTLTLPIAFSLNESGSPSG